MEEGSKASSDLFLYKVLGREAISRGKAKQLWKAGKITGLFNLPTEELFDACKDFGIKVSVDPTQKAEEEIEVLTSKLRVQIERSVEQQKQLNELKTQVAELSQESLLKEEQEKGKWNNLLKEKKSVQNEVKRLRKEKQKLLDENAALKKQVEEGGNEQEEQTALREEIEELQASLKTDRKHLKKIAEENRSLKQQLHQMGRENAELKLSSHLTQTDHLNRRLLQSFMTNMDATEHEWDEGDPVDDNGEDK